MPILINDVIPSLDRQLLRTQNGTSIVKYCHIDDHSLLEPLIGPHLYLSSQQTEQQMVDMLYRLALPVVLADKYTLILHGTAASMIMRNPFMIHMLMANAFRVYAVQIDNPQYPIPLGYTPTGYTPTNDIIPQLMQSTIDICKVLLLLKHYCLHLTLSDCALFPDLATHLGQTVMEMKNLKYLSFHPRCSEVSYARFFMVFWYGLVNLTHLDILGAPIGKFSAKRIRDFLMKSPNVLYVDLSKCYIDGFPSFMGDVFKGIGSHEVQVIKLHNCRYLTGDILDDLWNRLRNGEMPHLLDVSFGTNDGLSGYRHSLEDFLDHNVRHRMLLERLQTKSYKKEDWPSVIHQLQFVYRDYSLLYLAICHDLLLDVMKHAVHSIRR
jgi:hypothetical protein